MLKSGPMVDTGEGDDVHFTAGDWAEKSTERHQRFLV